MRKPKTKPARNIHGCGTLKEGYYLCWQTKAGKHEIGGNFAALRNICNTVSAAHSCRLRKQSYSRVRLCSRKTLPSVNWLKGHLWFNPKTHWEPIRLICLYVESRKMSWKWENFCDVQNSSSKNWELPLTVKDSEKVYWWRTYLPRPR